MVLTDEGLYRFYQDLLIECKLYESMNLNKKSRLGLKIDLFFYSCYINTLNVLHIPVSESGYRKNSLLEIELEKRDHPEMFCCSCGIDLS